MTHTRATYLTWVGLSLSRLAILEIKLDTSHNSLVPDRLGETLSDFLKRQCHEDFLKQQIFCNPSRLKTVNIARINPRSAGTYVLYEEYAGKKYYDSVALKMFMLGLS
jgi:hypothetical protein